ncbi:MAG: hypothetical protein LBM93_15490, partial [Oscillospiraceae bacterium]|nr:hypothetical protein [Oscillospiraceae bacterium]
ARLKELANNSEYKEFTSDGEIKIYSDGTRSQVLSELRKLVDSAGAYEKEIKDNYNKAVSDTQSELAEIVARLKALANDKEYKEFTSDGEIKIYSDGTRSQVLSDLRKLVDSARAYEKEIKDNYDNAVNQKQGELAKIVARLKELANNSEYKEFTSDGEIKIYSDGTRSQVLSELRKLVDSAGAYEKEIKDNYDNAVTQKQGELAEIVARLK